MLNKFNVSKSTTVNAVNKSTEPSSTVSQPEKPMKPRQIFTSTFEVFGRVQGVYFRKHTQSQAKKLGISGWCMNTVQGTVKGVLEGTLEAMTDMKCWLQYKGSPRSEIERATFTPNEEIPSQNYKSFAIRR